jgi:hypothetical protein
MGFFSLPAKYPFLAYNQTRFEKPIFILPLFKIQVSKVQQTFSYSAECWNIFVAWYNEVI